MANPGTGSAQGNELEQAGSFDASGQKIWINRATNDFMQMASGQLGFFFSGSMKAQFGPSSTVLGQNGSTLTTFNRTISLGNGGSIAPDQTGTILLATTGGAATQNWTNAIPANSLVFSCQAFVQTAITGCTSWSIGPAGSTTAFGTGLSVNQGTVADINTWAGGTQVPLKFGVATNIVLTAAGGGVVFTTGAVRIGIVFWQMSDFTS